LLPYTRVWPAPLAASEIVAFLETGFGSTGISLHRCGAADAQSVSRSCIMRLFYDCDRT
jgi:hypothetical protein